MGLANCKECGGLFVQVSRDICDRCFKEQEAILQKVQQYIKEHPNLSVGKLAEATGVDEALVLKFIRENRLVLSSSSVETLLNCESCGTPIVSGRLCAMCRAQLGAGLGGRSGQPSRAPVADSGERNSGRRQLGGNKGSQIKGKFQRR